MRYLKKPKIDFNILIVIVSLVVTLLLTPDLKSHFDNHINFWLSILVCFNVFIFFRTCLKILKSWVRYDLFFILGFLILHFQIPFLASIGIEPENPDFI